ncbi:MAG: exodeoxyribonuclease VII small subunit [Planctomycetota bacterium]
MARKKSGAPTFEELLRQTEEAVERLESGELPLEESLEEYEKGVRNLKACARLIEAAQKKVQQLIEETGGGVGLEDFEEPGEEET